jgi:hypothetical protein
VSWGGRQAAGRILSGLGLPCGTAGDGVEVLVGTDVQNTVGGSRADEDVLKDSNLIDHFAPDLQHATALTTMRAG